MNQLTTTSQTPIEIALQVDGEGRTTARKLYDFLGLDKKNYSRWCKMNILENSFAEETLDFVPFVIDEERNPNPTTDYKLTASFAKKLAMGCHNSKGEQARNYFIAVEDRLKEVATSQPISNLDISTLSPTTQVLIQVETRQNQQQRAIENLGKRIESIEGAMTTEKQVRIASVQTELSIAADIYSKTMKKDRISTERVAAMYCVTSRVFYETLHKLGLVVPGKVRGWVLNSEYENKGIGFSQNTTMEYAHVAWSKRGVELIKSMLKENGVVPLKRMPAKKKVVGHKGLI